MQPSGSHRIIILVCVAWMVALQISVFWPVSSGAQEVRTPAAPATPRVNGPTIFGVRPGSPMLYKIPASGNGTITYSVDNLPAGLSVNSSTGMITGTSTTPGTYNVTLRATNSLGSNTKNFRIVVGDTIALTPPLGWNSWNAYGSSINTSKWIAAAQGMVDSGLINYGWSYINIDDGWQASREGQPYTALQGNSNFSNMQSIADQIHALNLKVGLYSTPWVQSYAGYPGGSAMYANGHWVKDTGPKQVNQHILPWDIGPYHFTTNDATQWAVWSIDYLKYDWNPIELPETVEMENALRASGRDVVYSLSNSIPFSSIATLAPHANAWRTTGDISDTWSSMSSKGFGQDKWAPYQSPGHWNDPDMMVVGYMKWAGPSRLTPDEQYTHITLWSLMSAPMLLGNRMEYMDQPGEDPFTLNLLTNPEVLNVHQDALGDQAITKSGSGTNLRVYVKDMEDGSKAVGLFNLGSTAATVTANWSDVGITGSKMVRDLWRQIDRGEFNNQFSMVVAPHGAEMLRIFPATTVPGVGWNGGNGSGPTNWGVAANWASGTVPDGAGSKISLGTQAPANNVLDMVSVGRIVGNIDFSATTGTTIQSSGGYSLTLDNSNHDSMIKLAGNHTISAQVVLNNDMSINGTGTLTLSARVTGAHGLYLSSGNLTLTAANDYTGSTVVYDGTLRLNGDNLLPYGTGKGNVNLSSNSAVLELNNYNANINGLYGTAGSVRNSGASAKILTLGNANANGDYWGTVDGNLALTKIGTGTQTISGADNYSGLTTITAGTLKAGNDSALGTTAGGTTIQSGATLDVNAMYLGAESITVQGSGLGGNGAIVNNNITTARYLNALQFVTLAGDTTFGGKTDTAVANSGRWDIRANSTAILSTGGHAYNLTKTGGNQVTLVGVSVDTALANVNINQGIFSMETTTALGDPSKTVTVASGATLQFYKLTTPLNKKVQINGGTIYAHTNGASSDNTVVSNITLGSGGGIFDTGGVRSPDRTTPSASAALTFTGVISGTTTLTKQGPGKVTLTNTNPLSGTTNLNDGTLVVNGTLAGGVTLNPSPTAGTTTMLSGTGTIGGTTRDAATSSATTIISPAGDGAAGTLTLNNLTLNGYGQINFDLTSNPSSGNDLLNLTGNLTLAGISTMFINELSGSLAAGTYHLLHYNGTAPSAPVSYLTLGGLPIGGQQTYTLRDNLTPKYIDLLVTNSAALQWNGNGSSNIWDINTTSSWLNGGAPDTFNNLDNVIFDDLGSNSPAINISASVEPTSILVNNNTKNYTFAGAGKITGSAVLTKQGTGALILANTGGNDYTGTTTITSGTLQVGNGVNSGIRLGTGSVVNNAAFILNNPAGDNYTCSSIITGTGSLEQKGGNIVTLSSANTYSGTTIITAGTLKAGIASALGTSAGGTTITGGTLDVNGLDLRTETVTVQGTGVGGNGAIINSSVQQIRALSHVVLSGDTTFGGISTPPGGSGFGRWDIRDNVPTLSTNGNAYNLTKVGANQVSFVATTVDTALGNININGGFLGFQTSTNGMGDPSKTVTIAAGAALQFYGTTNAMNKKCVLNGGTIWAEAAGSGTNNTFSGPITVNSAGGVFDAGGGLTGAAPRTDGDLHITGSITGSGGVIKNGPATVFITGTTVNFAGNTSINEGILQINSGSAANVTLHSINGTGVLGIDNSTHITADSININTLTIAAGSKLTIAPLPGGPLAEADSMTPVPEPATAILLAMGGILMLIYRWQKKRLSPISNL